MKLKKLAPLLSLALSFELMVTPVMSYAQTTTAEKFAGAIDATGRIWSMVNSMQRPTQSPQSMYDMQMLQQQQTPTQDKYFNLQKLSQIPGLGDYMAQNKINPQMLECKTLPTTLHEIKAEVCQMGVTTDRNISPQDQLHEMFNYYNSYFQIEKMYKNFSADSNSAGQLFGVGCMNNAMNILNGFFKYRLDELDKLTTNLEAMQNQFREASRSDLDAIEETVAVLEGGNSNLTNKVRSKKPDLFDFGKRFQNPACNSMFDNENFNRIGRESGLNNIQQTLKDTITQKPPGSKYSGESYSTSHASVVEDLNSLANKVAKQAELRFSTLSENEQGYVNFLKGLQGAVSSTTGANQLLTADLFSDAQAKFTESSDKLNERLGNIQNELGAAGVNGSRAYMMVRNLNASGFENELGSIERQIQNGCIANSSVDTALSRMFQKSASDHANKSATITFANKIKKILLDGNTSLDKKKAELEALKVAQSDYFIRTDGPREVEFLDQNNNLARVRREGLQSPVTYFLDTVNNCKAQYTVNKLDNKLSGSEAVQNLRKLNQDYKTFAKNHAIELKKEVTKKLIECSSPEEANNTAIGSCTPDRFNTSAPGFCANAALSCSKNMQACTAQAEKYTKEIKDQRTARVNNYKALVEKNKKDIIKIFDSALSRYMKDGEMLRGVFGAGFTSPSDIQREVPEGSRYLSEFQQATSGSVDGSLLLENPDKFMELFKNNITRLKDSVKKQQDQILGGERVGSNQGLLAEHIRKTKGNYSEVAREADRISKTCIRKYEEFVKANEQQRAQQQAEAFKKSSELGEKRQQFCNLYSIASKNPNGACNQDLSDMMSAVPGDVLGEFQAWCSQSGNYNSENSAMNAYDMCDNDTIKNDKACTEYNKNRKCQVPETTSNGTEREVTDKECIADLEKQIASLYRRKVGAVPAPEAPAYCTAGDNSGRGGAPKDNMEAILQGLERGMQQSKQ